jgi:acetylornithine/succinyldiaminopimelate/putrescine aminotransferase
MRKRDCGDHFLRQNLKRGYPVIIRGQGHYLWDDQGKRYVDGASGGVGALLFGHAAPQVIRATPEQA